MEYPDNPGEVAIGCHGSHAGSLHLDKHAWMKRLPTGFSGSRTVDRCFPEDILFSGRYTFGLLCFFSAADNNIIKFISYKNITPLRKNKLQNLSLHAIANCVFI